MLYDLGLDPSTGDIALPIVNARPNVLVVSGLDKIRQQVYLTLLTFLGEWFLDTTFGLPYFTEILIKGPSGSKIRSILKTAVLAVPDVTQVTSVVPVINNVTRQLGVRITALTDLGEIALAAPLTSLPVGVWGQSTWGGSVWGTDTTVASAPASQSGIWDQSNWDNATWAP